MKPILIIVAWAFVSMVIVYAAVNPNGGVVYSSPVATLGIGLIGLGLCMEARKRLLPADEKARQSGPGK